MAPKIGWPTPQARFWMAIASENSARGQPNWLAMGIWNTPKLARTPKPTRRISEAAIRVGVMMRTAEAEVIGGLAGRMRG